MTNTQNDPRYRRDSVHDRRWFGLAEIAIAELMVVLDVTVVNIGLPSAQQDPGISVRKEPGHRGAASYAARPSPQSA